MRHTVHHFASVAVLYCCLLLAVSMAAPAGADGAAPVAPRVTAPNGGETWLVSSIRTITWSTGNGGKVTIELSRDNGASWETLFASTANDGREPWTVSGPVTTGALVRVSNGNGSDTSNRVFAIRVTGAIWTYGPRFKPNYFIRKDYPKVTLRWSVALKTVPRQTSGHVVLRTKFVLSRFVVVDRVGQWVEVWTRTPDTTASLDGLAKKPSRIPNSFTFPTPPKGIYFHLEGWIYRHGKVVLQTDPGNLPLLTIL